MYLELSRPAGDVTRWEKVLKRLTLLNRHYPMKNPRCNELNFMRDFEGNQEDQHYIYNIVKNSIIDQGLVFFGGYASTLYGRHMPASQKRQLQKVPDFDILAEDPKMSKNSRIRGIKSYLQKGCCPTTIVDDTVCLFMNLLLVTI